MTWPVIVRPGDWPAQIRDARQASGLLTLDDEVRVAREEAET